MDDSLFQKAVNKSINWDNIRSNFLGNTPFKWTIIDNFLEPSFAQSLLNEFPRHTNPTKLLNEFGQPNPKATVTNVRELGGSYRVADDLIKSEIFLGLIQYVTNINELKYDPYYFGAGTHENFDTAGLDAHFDFNLHPITKQHRRLNLIVYLNLEWNSDWGGHICLHSNPYDVVNDEVIELEPLFNRAILFETNEYSWHSVKPVRHPNGISYDNSRKSFTVYYYSDSRPIGEIAPSHGTIYVQPNLPSHFRVGHALTEADLITVRANIDRRNSYLKQLYMREYQFSEEISNLHSIINSLRNEGQPLLPLSGSSVLTSISKDLYNDGFVGEKLSFICKLVRSINHGLTLTGYVPEHLFSEDQCIYVTVSASNDTMPSQCVEVYSPSGSFSIVVPLSLEANTELKIEIKAAQQFISVPPDQRKLSFMLTSVDII